MILIFHTIVAQRIASPPLRTTPFLQGDVAMYSLAAGINMFRHIYSHLFDPLLRLWLRAEDIFSPTLDSGFYQQSLKSPFSHHPLTSGNPTLR
ncbi:hypothetical protein CF328_g1156 [Tilletia controversa]|nr:hypothetical protein CF328_g1156 [Tilletia controversa]